MCGICLLLRQRLVSTPATTTPTSASPPPPSSPLRPSTATTNADTVVQANPFYPVPTKAAHDLGGGGHRCCGGTLFPVPAELTHSLVPCACPQAGLEVKEFLGGGGGDSSGNAAADLFAEMVQNVRRRGPNTYGVTRRSFSTVCEVPAESGASLMHPPGSTAAATAAVSVRTDVAGVASVLGLRGHSTVAQPYDMSVETDAEEDAAANVSDQRSSLLWNGEIFGGALCPPPWGSDTVLLASRLSHMELECVNMTEHTEAGLRSLPLAQRQRMFLRKCTTLFEQQVEGPYSFIFIATRLRLTVFGRDPLGRHSLLTHVRVTAPPVRHAGTSPAGAAPVAPSPLPTALDVELIISSVGVQHRLPATAVAAVNDASVTTTVPSPLCSSSFATSAAVPMDGGSGSGSGSGGGGGGGGGSSSSTSGSSGVGTAKSKRPRHESVTAVSFGSTPPLAPPHLGGGSPQDVAEDDDDDAAAGAGGVEVCWEEVGVTGLFAVPLQAPLVYRDAAAVSAGAGAAAQTADVGETDDVTPRLHPVSLSAAASSAGTAGRAEECPHAAAISGAHVMLLHCPWQRTDHLVHPLLRTAGQPMVPHEPPPFELILAHEEIAVLPEPLLQWARNLMTSAHHDTARDQRWVDWAAAHYMLALAVSMHRRITVANSGVADSRDAHELSTARRRPLCILYSGGIDCTVIAALAHYLLPMETPIELVNVAFGETPEQAPDRVAAFRSMEELLRLPLLHTSRDDAAYSPGAAAGAATTTTTAAEREWRLVLVDVPSKMTPESAHIKDLLVPRHTVMDLDIGTALWYAARAAGRMQVLRRSDVVGVASSSTTATPLSCSPTSPSVPTRLGGGSPAVTLDGFSKHFRAYTGAAPVAGLARDAALHDMSFPGASAASLASTPPTAVAVAAATAELDSAATTQKYQILVDVLVKEGRSGTGPQTPVLLSTLGKEYSLFLQPHIKRYGYKKLGSFLNDAAKAGYVKFAPDAPSKAVRLCRPCDMARAAAVPPSPWFTTEYMKTQEPTHDPDGTAQSPSPCPGTFHESYVSHAKVVLLGMGADETLGGYTRYRRFYQREGMAGAQRELERDFARLWQRNLGRDDRITMDSGREPRFPFLDEGVVRTLEWIVLKHRNNILATYETSARRAAEARLGGVVSPTSPTVSPASPLRPGGPREAAPPPLTSDELLRLALDPIVSFRLNPGEGDKRVLRRVAGVLGLSDVTHLQKRAIQFGSRIAERKIRGTNDF
ncbi:Asparagine synthase [Novymonas esmeraldas]|uniref:Asparagine synthase n=1 Tax=Novymonas esmeraldas TaxID=1808958 RepID=A0AAW0F4J0_9TRYP